MLEVDSFVEIATADNFYILVEENVEAETEKTNFVFDCFLPMFNKE